MAEYPNNRDRGFAYRYIRTMTKSTAAQHMGTAGFAICCVVAMQEDVVKYSRPVVFWNRSLADIIGAAKTDTMAKARDKAVAAGWLHYENRGPRTAGIYWVTVPPEAKDIVERDWGCDEGAIDPQNGTKDGSMLEQPTQKTGAFAGQSWVNDGVDDGSLHSASSSASSSTKNPPKSPQGDAGDEPDPELLGWIESWNNLADGGYVPHRVKDPKGSAITKGWKRFRENREVRGFLADRDAVLERIRGSPLCRKGWFRFEKLFGARNGSGALICQVLMEGGYADRDKQSTTADAGKRHGVRSW